MESKRILVIGGTGYVGKALAERLAKSFDVTLLVRKMPEEKCKYFFGDLMDKESLLKIDNFDLVINLASVVRTINKKKYKENVEGLRNLIEVLEKKKIKKTIYFSTQNVNLKNKGPYSKSKKLAEDVLKNSDIEHMIVRPNYVYEIGKNNYFYKMARMISRLNIAFIIGSGKNKIQPILREELADIVVDLVKNFKSKSIVEISGKESIDINEIAHLIGKELGKKPFVIHLPIKILKLFKWFVPFDVEGFDEDRVSKCRYKNYKFSSFRDNLRKIVELSNKPH